MNPAVFFAIFVLFLSSPFHALCLAQGLNPSPLIGEWILDMTPQDTTDANVAMMRIDTADQRTFEGTFYREGVNIQEGRINIQTGVLYAALVSEDGSGTYHTTFYYENDVLYGTTHAIDRQFLSVWKATRASTQSTGHIPVFEKSSKGPFEIKEDQKHTFGYLLVPENRSDANSATIQLPVYIFKSRSTSPKKDPIIWLTGGPGESVMNAAKYTQYYEYLEDRDLILFEQRGTAYAHPHLACPEWSLAASKATDMQLASPTLDKTSAEVLALYTSAAAACRDRLIGEGIDLEGYTTFEIAADVDDLRKALGLDHYNLYTISYGTRIAQILMRDYPKHIRSVVMDSPLPLSVRYDEQSIRNLLDTYTTVFATCRNDTACNAAYPDLETRFFDFLQKATDNPISIPITLPTGESRTYYLKGKNLALLYGVLRTAESPAIPMILNQILNGDLALVQQAITPEPPGSGSGMGMRLSVWCAEEMPLVTRDRITQESTRYPAIKGAYPATFYPEVCDTWEVPPRTDLTLPLTSAIPTLILSGSFDETTPPAWGALLDEHLANSTHLVFKGYRHGVTTYWDNTCGMRTANAFFNAPNNPPVLPCFEALDAFHFAVE